MPNQAKTAAVESRKEGLRKGRIFSSPYGTPPPPSPIPTAAPPRGSTAVGRLAGMAGQIAEACLAVTSQRVPHKFSPAALRAS